MDISYGYNLMSLCPEDTDIEWLTLLSMCRVFIIAHIMLSLVSLLMIP
jgi:hypothetical protein